MTDSELLHDGSDPRADEASEVDVESAESAGSPDPVRSGRVRRSMFDDSRVRVMAWAAAGLVLLYLATILGALVMGVVGSTAPKTSPERALAVTEARYKSGERSEQAVGQYIAALIELGRYAKAQQIIDASIDTVDQTRGGQITLQQAQLYYARGKYKDAIASAAEARAIIKKKYDAELKSKNLSESRSYGFPASYMDAIVLQARANEKLGDWKAAVASYDEYIKQDKAAADLLIARGYAKIELGDKDGAEADFRAALNYIPDDVKALAGLKKIGADK